MLAQNLMTCHDLWRDASALDFRPSPLGADSSLSPPAALAPASSTSPHALEEKTAATEAKASGVSVPPAAVQSGTLGGSAQVVGHKSPIVELFVKPAGTAKDNPRAAKDGISCSTGTLHMTAAPPEE